MPLDITLTPLHRVGGQEQASLPGLMAAVPPRQAARGRDQDRLILFLQIAGRGMVSSGDVVQTASRAAVAFYATPGTITSALRSAAASIGQTIYQRNRAKQDSGQYVVGVLGAGVLRASQITLLLSGPMQAFILADGGNRHISESLSGRGLGLGNSTPHYFASVALAPGDRMVLCSSVPNSWEAVLGDPGPGKFADTRRKLMALAPDNVSAVLIGAAEGSGAIHLQRAVADAAKGSAEVGAPETEQSPQPKVGTPPGSLAAERGASGGSQLTSSMPPPSIAPPDAEAAPSAYAIPPQTTRARTPADDIELDEDRAPGVLTAAEAPQARESHQSTLIPRERQRAAARSILRGLEALRRNSDRIRSAVQSLLPRLLPMDDSNPWTLGVPAMLLVAILVPLVVVGIASAVYFRFGRSVQYEQYLVQIQEAREQARTLTDPVAQREAWQRVLFYLDRAEEYTATAETGGLRVEARQQLDELLGIRRLEFQPAFGRSVGAQIGRLAATENDAYLLDAQRGAVLHLALTDSGFQLDTTFDCAPGTYGTYTVGPLVDVLALPTINALNATVIAVDASGNLLNCAPGQVAQAVALTPPDTNWGRIRSLALDSGNLYVLDAESRAVWVYVGEDGTFVDLPYFYFGGQIPQLEDAIDLAVNADDLYLLHADGRLSTCSYSHIESVPTRCVDPAPLTNPFEAYRDVDLFEQAHFTQLMLSPPPDSSLLLLDADGQGVFRFAPRTLELQSQWRPLADRAMSMPTGEVSAMALSPNHVLYFALRDRIYFAADAP